MTGVDCRPSASHAPLTLILVFVLATLATLAALTLR